MRYPQSRGALRKPSFRVVSEAADGASLNGSIISKQVVTVRSKR